MESAPLVLRPQSDAPPDIDPRTLDNASAPMWHLLSPDEAAALMPPDDEDDTA